MFSIPPNKRNPVGTSPAFPRAKIRAYFTLCKSLQGLQEFGNQRNISYRKTLEKSKSLQGLQRFAGRVGKGDICRKRNRNNHGNQSTRHILAAAETPRSWPTAHTYGSAGGGRSHRYAQHLQSPLAYPRQGFRLNVRFPDDGYHRRAFCRLCPHPPRVISQSHGHPEHHFHRVSDTQAEDPKTYERISVYRR